MILRIVVCLVMMLTVACGGKDRASEESQKPPTRNNPEGPGTVLDWAQPPLACVEDVVPRPADRPCLDLSQVKNVNGDFPEGMSPDDIAYWKSQRRGLEACRAQELLRRESLNPGTYSPVQIQLAWMRVMSIDNFQEKMEALVQSSDDYAVPLYILTGALTQESQFSGLGIAEDGGNFSCGIGQINISEWCQWAIRQPEDVKKEIGFPADQKDCRLAQLPLIKPLYEIAKTRLNGLPEYRLMPEHFEGIALDQVVANWPPADPKVQQQRYDLIFHFLRQCRHPKNGIRAKAFQLSEIHRRFVPEGLKKVDLYEPDQKFQKTCQYSHEEKNYPLPKSWLLAVGIYNAGPRAVDALAFYNDWTVDQLKDPATFSAITPHDLVEAFYWGGVYREDTDLIHFTGRRGEDLTWTWFKTCVLQRHIARVVNHVTDPAVPRFIDSLERGVPCKRSQRDPATGKVISGVPDFRKASSGKKAPPVSAGLPR